MKYTLWDIETSNQFGEFEDENDVQELVRTLVKQYGTPYADELGLGRVTDEGVLLEPLSGAALIDWVAGASSERRPADPIGNAMIGAHPRSRGVA